MGKWLARLAALDDKKSLAPFSHPPAKTDRRGLVSVLAVCREGYGEKNFGASEYREVLQPPGKDRNERFSGALKRGPAEFRATIKKDDEKFQAGIKKRHEEKLLRIRERGREKPSDRPHALTEAEADLAHAKSWDEAACGRFVARVTLFIRRGVDATDADDLAERMHLREVNGDDRVTCIECSHYRPGAAEDCGNSVKAAARVRGPDAATLLQRCPGFATAIDEEDRP